MSWSRFVISIFKTFTKKSLATSIYLYATVIHILSTLTIHYVNKRIEKRFVFFFPKSQTYMLREKKDARPFHAKHIARPQKSFFGGGVRKNSSRCVHEKETGRERDRARILVVI